MYQEEIVSYDYEGIFAYLNGAKLFSSIPKLYQDKIVNYFVENTLWDHIIASPYDIRLFFSEGEEIIIFTELEEMVSFARTNDAIGLAYYGGCWKEEKYLDFIQWGLDIADRIDPDTYNFRLVKLIDESSEETDTRWFMLSCMASRRFE